MPAAPIPPDEPRRLRSLARLRVLDTAPEAEFEALVRAASLTCGVPISLISLVDAGRQWFKANLGLEGTSETPREVAFCSHAILGDDLMEVHDASADPRFRENPLVTGAPDIRFYAGMPLRLADGSAVGTLCVIDRVPRRLDARQRAILRELGAAAVHALESHRGLRAEAEAVADLDRVRREFIAVAAHELRTPLTSVAGFVELMLAREMPPERQRGVLLQVADQCQTMMELMGELLDMAHLEDRGARDLALEPLALGELAAQALVGLRVPEGREPPRLHLAPEGDDLVDGDAPRLRQVLNNLLSNAYKYSPGGGPVDLRIERDGDTVRLQVVDQGIGMTPEQLGHVAEKFFRAHRAGPIPGTGLGLSIVKEIATLHGGRLQVDSESGRGTCVTVTLPARAAA